MYWMTGMIEVELTKGKIVFKYILGLLYEKYKNII